MYHPQRLAGLSFFVDRDEHRKLLVCIASDKLFHIAAAPPFLRGFARSLRETPLQRFHSINIGSYRAERHLKRFRYAFIGLIRRTITHYGACGSKGQPFRTLYAHS